MRVAIVVNGRAHQSGVTSYINNIVGPLRDLGCDVDVISPLGITTHRPVKAQATKRADKLLSKQQWLTPLAYRVSKLVLYRYLSKGNRRQPYDVAYGIDASALLAASWLRKRQPKLRLVERVGASIPLDLVAQGKLPANSRWLDYFRGEESKAFSTADAIIPNSTWSENYIRKLAPDARLMPRMVSPVDTGFFHPDPEKRDRQRQELGLAEGERMILFPSRLDPRKGVLVLLEAFLKLRQSDPKLHLVCVGRGRQEAELRERVRQEGLEACVHLPGMCSREEMARLYAAADAAAVPSVPVEGYQEPLPNCLLEAFASGAPVVASDTGGIPDVLEHEVNGLLAEAGNADALAAALKRLLDDDALRKTLRTGADKFVQSTCQPKMVAQRLMEIFQP